MDSDNIAPPADVFVQPNVTVHAEMPTEMPVELHSEMPVELHSDEGADEYMELFGQIDDDCKEMRRIIDSIAFQPDQDARFAVVTRYLVRMQIQIEQMCNLMVEMNNQFADRG